MCTNHEKHPICTQLAQSVLAIATAWGRLPFRRNPTCHAHELKIKIDFQANGLSRKRKKVKNPLKPSIAMTSQTGTRPIFIKRAELFL